MYLLRCQNLSTVFELVRIDSNHNIEISVLRVYYRRDTKPERCSKPLPFLGFVFHSASIVKHKNKIDSCIHCWGGFSLSSCAYIYSAQTIITCNSSVDWRNFKTLRYIMAGGYGDLSLREKFSPHGGRFLVEIFLSPITKAHKNNVISAK